MENNHLWRVGEDYGIMAIINITPDSFFDGGKSAPECVTHAGKALEQGAHILDIGAESTRPGAMAISPEVERKRLAGVLPAITRAFPDAVISVDTRNAPTARWALENGAHIINDVSGLRHDGDMPGVLGEYKPGYVLVHSIGTPENMQHDPAYDDIIDEVEYFFENSLETLVKAGLPEQNIALDPGIGFGKTLEHNLQLLAGARRFLRFGRPLVVGLSMKSLFGQLLGLGKNERATASAVATALLWERGVFWHRVHDVAAADEALALAASLHKIGINSVA